MEEKNSGLRELMSELKEHWVLYSLVLYDGTLNDESGHTHELSDL